MLTISDATRHYCFDKQQDDQLVSEKNYYPSIPVIKLFKNKQNQHDLREKNEIGMKYLIV